MRAMRLSCSARVVARDTYWLPLKKIPMPDSIRTRLTLWHVGVLALALIVFSAGVYLLLARTLYRRMDESLLASSDSIATSLVRERAEGESESEAAHSTVDELHLLNQAMAIFDADGRLLAEKAAPGSDH